ncbi:MAG: hypothetical protein CL482_13200 [Acidobacteria bacterium]|nr:hypothetical protein [Acidobacteriota bacterium]
MVGVAEPAPTQHTDKLIEGLEVDVPRVQVLTAALLFLSLAGPAAAQRPDFSGMWTLDEGASEVTPPAFSGGRGGGHTERLFITHAANGTVVIGAETNGVKAWSFTPGRGELSIPVGRDTSMMASSRWDGNRLVAEGTQGEMTMHEVMSLSADGSILTIEVDTTTPDGETHNRLVYTMAPPVGPCKAWAMPCKDFPQGAR